nr:hypothetical protein [uncultured Rhodopila sp.]
MTDLELRLLANALKLRRFTSDRLAAESGVNVHSARSWLRRNPHIVNQQQPTGIGEAGRGRPRAVWQLRPEMDLELRAQLERAYPLGAPVPSFSLETAGYLRDLKVIEEYIESWRAAAKRNLADDADMSRAAAQSRIAATWLSFADLDASGHSVDQSTIKRLIVFETELGIAAAPALYKLPLVAKWTAERLNRMIGAGASPSFAARVLSARASAQSLPWQARLLLASFAAPVWADEGLVEMSGLSADEARRCILVADAVPVARRLEIFARALEDPAALAVKWTPDQRQAALLGLADRQYAKPLRDVQRWLWELPFLKACWAEEHALAVWYGIGESQLNSVRVVRELRNSARNGIDITRRWPNLKIGRLRGLAIDWCERLFNQPDRPEHLDTSNLQFAAAYLRGRGFVDVEAAA